MYLSVLEIAKLVLCQIVIFEKTPNIIVAKYSRFTVPSEILVFKNYLMLV